MSQMRIHLTYYHQDDAFRRALVEALQQAGADVLSFEICAWDDDAETQEAQEAQEAQETQHEEYDQDDDWVDEPVPWDETIASSYDEVAVSRDDFEVRWDDEGNPLFSSTWGHYKPPSVYLVLLSQAALASRSFQVTVSVHYKSVTNAPVKLLVAVTTGPIEQRDVTVDTDWQFLAGVKRIEAPDRQPLPLEEAVRRTLEALCLTPVGTAPVLLTPEPMESAQDLLMRGNALFAQGRYTEALAFFKQATHRVPDWFAAWFNLGYTLFKLKRWLEVVAANERATALNPTFVAAWNNLGAALNQLQRSEEGLAACERALSLDPHYAIAWSNKGNALCKLTRYDEALVAYDHALRYDPMYASAWNNKSVALNDLERYQEALVAVNHALTLDRTVAEFWDTRGEVLHGLHRDEEALHCFDQAITIAPLDGYYWKAKAMSLRALGATTEAEDAERLAQELGE